MRHYLLIVLLAFCAISFANRNKTLEHIIAQGKLIPSEEDLMKIFSSYGYQADPKSERFTLFKQRLPDIVKHNTNPNKTHTLEINKFAFQTLDELNNLRNAQNCSATAKYNFKSKGQFNLKDIPASFDWRDYNIVTPVKNQGACGSCWTFSTTGALESHWAIHTQNSPILLSEQQLIDCAQDFNNFGCSGGLPSQAFEYIANSGGLQTESDYPYEGTDNSCEFNPSQVAAKVSASYNITFQDENELLYHLATVGPISIAYEVTNDFFLYKEGVYSNPHCSTSPDKVNHAVLVVGYGTLEGKPYYIVKNSWGEDWGLKGYFLIERGSNMCGLADCASYPLIPRHISID